jgi:hypothetical protein
VPIPEPRIRKEGLLMGASHGLEPVDGQRPAVADILRMVGDAIGSDLTATQTKAAKLMSKILDPQQVDAILDLPAGSVEGWMSEPKFVAEVADDRRRAEMYGTAPSADFGRALTPKQRAAARALTIERQTQSAAAATAGVDPRSIRNWLRQPAFASYQDQLREEHEGQESIEWRNERVAFERRLREGQSTALEAVIKAIEGGDTKAALELLRQQR